MELATRQKRKIQELAKEFIKARIKGDHQGQDMCEIVGNLLEQVPAMVPARGMGDEEWEIVHTYFWRLTKEWEERILAYIAD